MKATLAAGGGAGVISSVISGLPIPSSAAAILGIAVVLVLTGRLKTRRDWEDMRTERDYWRSVALEQQSQKGELMVTTRVMNEFLREFPVKSAPGEVSGT